jgi:hypothetical protein
LRRVLLPLLLLASSALAQDQAERDRGFLTGLIEDNLSSTARQVVVEGFEGALSTRATVERLTIADAEGVWLDARDLTLDWDRTALLGGRIEIEELSAGSIEILRAPVPDPETVTPEATRFSLPDLPVAVRIGALEAGRIVLGEPLLGTELVLTLDGSVSLEGGEGAASVSAVIVEGSEGSLDFDASYANETRVLDLSLALSEAPDGIVANALGLPGRPSVDLTLAGTAPIDDYQATASLATDGTPRVSGDFALKTTAPAEAGEVVARAFGVDIDGDVTSLVAPGLRDFFGPDVSLLAKGIRRSDGSFRLSSLDLTARALTLRGEAEVTPEFWPTEIELSGTLGTDGGEAVLVPGTSDVTVQRAVLDVRYDQAEGDAWTGAFAITALERPGVRVPSLALEGGGVIVPATAERRGRFTADLGYDVLGLTFDSAGLGAALGADVSGDVALVRDDTGGPLRVTTLTVTGPGVEAMAEGTVAGPDAGFLVQSSLMLRAESLERFALLAGLDLRGAADVTVVSSLRPLDGIFDVILTGATTDLALGVAELDSLLAGEGAVRLAAARDEAGLRLETLSLGTDAVTIGAEAEVTSEGATGAFDLRLADLGLSIPTLSGPASVTGTAARDEGGAITVDASASAPGVEASLRATLPATPDGPAQADPPAPLTFQANASIEALAPYAPLVARFAPGLSPAGAAEIGVSGTARRDASTFDVGLRVETADLSLGLARLDPLLSGAGLLTARVARTGPEDFVVEDARVATDLLSGTVSAQVAGGVGRAEADLAVSEVEAVLPGLAGPARLTGTAALDGTEVALDLDAGLEGVAVTLDGVLDRTATHAFTGEAAVEVADLAPFAELLSRPSRGASTHAPRARCAPTSRPST